jgi:hypothetical protein
MKSTPPLLGVSGIIPPSIFNPLRESRQECDEP